MTKLELKKLIKESLRESFPDELNLPEITDKVCWVFDPDFRPLVHNALDKYAVGFKGEGKILVTYSLTDNAVYHVSYLLSRSLENDPLIGNLMELEITYLTDSIPNKDFVYQRKINKIVSDTLQDYINEKERI